jgi:hypothetical protein
MNSNLVDKANLSKNKVDGGVAQNEEKQGEIHVGEKVIEQGEGSAGNNWEKVD